ncbi:HpcH/HpaI aldolase/citrate lyase family protein [Brevibacillus sp. NPDC058079]|uniref:HpcH/HpaI aldolase/citrate lyase family protein n=1 Tax=Brevibacillus sp. NPDC058079 TaxID=3346330 RepID=UPI0036E54733
MKHFQYLSVKEKEQIFEIQPQEFSKETDREELAYALGATLYMPSYQDILGKLMNKEMNGLTSFVMCFEDAIRVEDVKRGQENVKRILASLVSAIQSGTLAKEEVPLFFVRVRNFVQFQEFSEMLTFEEVQLLTGFVFPKFDSFSGEHYLEYLRSLNKRYQTKLYGLPILESSTIMHQETRMTELINLKQLLSRYRKYILNVRVGGTDFSSLFGLRRGIDFTMYDIMVVADVLKDIQNVLMRSGDGFVVSAPVWEYFPNQRILKNNIRVTPFEAKNKLTKRQHIIDKAIDGLIRELILDKANGFCGKTIIHPSHISYVNAFQVVTKEEYEDADMILNNSGGGVLKSSSGNKMNEMNPHMSWAKKILIRAKLYGVVKDNDSYIDLF